MALGVGESLIGQAVDGLILADVDVVRVLGDVQVGAVGDIAEVAVLGTGGDDYLAVLLRLGNGLLGPGAGLDIHGLAVSHQIPGDGGKLEGCAALQE